MVLQRSSSGAVALREQQPSAESHSWTVELHLSAPAALLCPTPDSSTPPSWPLRRQVTTAFFPPPLRHRSCVSNRRGRARCPRSQKNSSARRESAAPILAGRGCIAVNFGQHPGCGQHGAGHERANTLLQHRKQRHQSLAEWQRKHKERQRRSPSPRLFPSILFGQGSANGPSTYVLAADAADAFLAAAVESGIRWEIRRVARRSDISACKPTGPK